MKVVLDGYWWVSGPQSLRHVLREIVIAWNATFPADEITMVVREKDVVVVLVDMPAGISIRCTRLWPQALSASVAVPRVARDVGADLVITHNFAARCDNRLSAVYLHDVLFATNPDWFTAVERGYFSLMTRWVHHADLVFASTNSEAARITLNTSADIVVPVGLGLSTELIDENAGEDPDDSVLPHRFVLTVGRLNVRKNLGAVIRAALLSQTISPVRPLVIVGSADGRGEGLDASFQPFISDGSVRFVGTVSEQRLRWYYRNTSLFVFMSLGEGFGMPPVEAAYFGAPILVSDLPVFHENLGASASYVDPTDIPAIARALTRGVTEGEHPDVARGLQPTVAARHDWTTTVSTMRAAAVATHRNGANSTPAYINRRSH